MTNADIATGQTALKAYVESVDGWEADFVPAQAYEDGAIDVIKVMDAAAPGTNPAQACGIALYNAIAAAGYGDRVTTEQCESGAAAVIAAVTEGRKVAAK